MQSLSDWVSNLSTTDPFLWTAIALGLTVILLFLILGRRPKQAPNIVMPSLHDLNIDSDNWEKSSQARADERRRALRRAGLPTAIQVADPQKRTGKPFEAYVIDRSAGGLRVAIERPYNMGKILQVKPAQAAEGEPWIDISVRSCREVGDYFEIGCQFTSEVELGKLLMFG